MSARSQFESSRAERRCLRREERLVLQVSRARGSVVSIVQRRSIIADEARRCAVSKGSVSSDSIVRRA